MKILFTIFLCFITNSFLTGQFKVKVNTYYKVYYYGQPFNIFVTAINFTTQPHNMRWNSTCEASYKIIGKYNWIDNNVCRDTSTDLYFGPEESNTWSFFYDNPPLPPGHYKIAGEVIGYGKTDTIQVNIIDTLSNKYAAYYTATVKDSATGLPDIVMAAAEGADSIYTNGKGRFLLEFYSSAFADSQTIHPLVKILSQYDDNYSRRITISKGDSITGPDIILKSHRPPIVSGRVNYGGQGTGRKIDLYFLGRNYFGDERINADSNGIFSAYLNPGSYYVLCGLNYYVEGYKVSRQEYYKNTLSLDDAGLLNINKDTSGINFNFAAIQTGTISGTVKDAVTHQPLSQALVKVFTDTLNLHQTFTDANGNYSMNVPEGSYYVSASKTYLYIHKVYNDSTAVVVDSSNLNVRGINFSLVKEQISHNSIVGFVNDGISGKALSNVKVYAIPDSGGAPAQTNTDNYGRYAIEYVANGKYILLFDKTGYKSIYYNNAYKWEDAYVFNCSGYKYVEADSVFLVRTDTTGGKISGKIYTASDSALSDALIYAINSSDSVVSTALSRTDGTYTIPYLQNGDYIIKASEAGYKTEQYPEKIHVDLNQQPVVNGVNFNVNITGVKNNNNTIPVSYKLFQNYPNPFNPATTIKYKLPEDSYVRIIIYDILGNKVKELVNAYRKAGNYRVKWDAKNLASGIYFYSMQAGDFRDTKKLLFLK